MAIEVAVVAEWSEVGIVELTHDGLAGGRVVMTDDRPVGGEVKVTDEKPVDGSAVVTDDRLVGGKVMMTDDRPDGGEVMVTDEKLVGVAVVGAGGVIVVLVGCPVLPPEAEVVVFDEPGPSEFFDTSAAKPGFVPCAKSWYQWPTLSWMLNVDVLLAGVAGATVEYA